MVNNSEELTTASNPSAPRDFVKKHRIALSLWGIAFLLLIILIRYTQHKAQAADAAGGNGRGGQNAPVAVSVARALYAAIQIKIPALGTVTPLATVTVRTQLSGQLQKIAFTEGQLVHKGDLIAQIDPRPYAAALAQVKGNLRRDQALLADAKLDLTRFEGLIKEDSIAQQTLDTQRALVDQYGGTVEADRAQLSNALLNLQYAHIVSPMTGRAGLRQVDQGNYVTPGDAGGIVVINQLQPISVIFSIPEDHAAALMRRLHAGGALAVDAYDRTNSTRLASGKLLTVDNVIDTTTGTVKLRALFENAEGSLFPNQFVNIQLLQELLRNQITIPAAAVRRGAPNGVLATFVYLVNPDLTVAVRPVTLGTVEGERVAVAAGLRVGDIVVTEGGDRLRDGARVVLPETAGKAVHHPGQHP